MKKQLLMQQQSNLLNSMLEYIDKRIDEILEKKLEHIHTVLAPEKALDKKEMPRNTKVENIFNTRVSNSLRSENILTLEELLNTSLSEIKKIYNLGDNSFGIVQRTLYGLGYKYNKDDNKWAYIKG